MPGRRRRAFTLMENLFAIFVVAVCAGVMAATLPLANSSRGRADLMNRAVSVAQKQLEAVKSVGYPNLTASRLLSFGLIDSTTTAPNGMYRFTNVDSAAFDAPRQVLPQGVGFLGVADVALDVRRVTVRVEWRERGRDRVFEVASLVANL